MSSPRLVFAGVCSPPPSLARASRPRTLPAALLSAHRDYFRPAAYSSGPLPIFSALFLYFRPASSMLGPPRLLSAHRLNFWPAPLSRHGLHPFPPRLALVGALDLPRDWAAEPHLFRLPPSRVRSSLKNGTTLARPVYYRPPRSPKNGIRLGPQELADRRPSPPTPCTCHDNHHWPSLCSARLALQRPLPPSPSTQACAGRRPSPPPSPATTRARRRARWWRWPRWSMWLFWEAGLFLAATALFLETTLFWATRLFSAPTPPLLRWASARGTSGAG